MRIIAGAARGRKIEALRGWDTRPTPDRVREALFGMLQFEVPGSTVLDLFSGSGAMGLEAASRGAARVFCNDADPACVRVIANNSERLGFCGVVEVVAQDYIRAIERFRSEGLVFDLAFLDPPYQTSFAEDACQRLLRYGMIADIGIVAVEHAPAGKVGPPSGMRLVKTRVYAGSAVTLLAREF